MNRNELKTFIKKVITEYLKEKETLEEMSTTGGVAGYSTPFAFTKNKDGSQKGTEAAEKYGTVVKRGKQ